MFLENLAADRRPAQRRGAGWVTLIEPLVVMLILGNLADHRQNCLPNQREKAKHASAKSMARTAETAMADLCR